MISFWLLPDEESRKMLRDYAEKLSVPKPHFSLHLTLASCSSENEAEAFLPFLSREFHPFPLQSVGLHAGNEFHLSCCLELHPGDELSRLRTPFSDHQFRFPHVSLNYFDPPWLKPAEIPPPESIRFDRLEAWLTAGPVSDWHPWKPDSFS